VTGPRHPAERQPLSRPKRPSALRPGARPAGPGRRSKPIRRASAGLTPTRAGALLALLVACAGVYGAASSSAFAARSVVITGAELTGEDVIQRTLDLSSDQNLFTLSTAPLRERLESLAPVLSAAVSVGLPDTVRVTVTEREPLLIWVAGERRFLVDADGLLFLELGPERPPTTTALPVMGDTRAASGTLDVGTRLDPIDLDAALRLGSLRPADVGSSAARLTLRVDDAEGFTMRSGGDGWAAVFGFYTPTLRTTELIPGQVRLLRSLLSGREAEVQKVVLADDSNGTYIPRPTPAPSATVTP